MAIKYALLALLAEKPRTASALQQQFIALTEGTQTLNIGQVSQTLSRLERNNFIARAGTVRNPSGHQVEQYEITSAGQELLTEWLERPVIRAMTDRDELVTKIAIAATRPDWDLISLLDTQRSAVLSQLKELNRQNRKLPQQRTAARLTIERRIYDLEAEARWLDRVEALDAPAHTETPEGQ